VAAVDRASHDHPAVAHRLELFGIGDVAELDLRTFATDRLGQMPGHLGRVAMCGGVDEEHARHRYIFDDSEAMLIAKALKIG